MLKFETLNELTLKVTSDGNGRDELFTKTGAWIGGECYGGQNWKFDRVLLGPEGNPMQAIAGQIFRRFTGENLPLVKVQYGGPSVTYFANEAQHVIPIKLAPGEQINVESENILGFYNCKYGIRFLATGVVSQKGLATSTLTGMGNDSYAIILSDGNPIVMSNQQNGSTLECDPDCLISFTGKQEPQITWNVGIKLVLGRAGANGETYAFKFTQPTIVIMQPNERASGLDIGMDGKGGKPTSQNNGVFRQDGNQGNMGNVGSNPLGTLGGALGGLGGAMNGQPGQGMGGNPGAGGLGGLGGIIGGIINS